MPTTNGGPKRFSPAKVVVSLAVFALVLKILLAYVTLGTNDATTWENDLVKLRADGFAELYRDGVYLPDDPAHHYPQYFIHPPPVLHILKTFGAFEESTGLPLRFWLRLLCAFADLATLCLVWRIRGPGTDWRALALLALSPIGITISGFHMNTDPVMICFVVASVWFVERKQFGIAGVAFGLAAGIKLVPVLFVPAFLLYLPDHRNRLRWALAALATWLVIGLPYLAREPGLILSRILGYGGWTGWWGIYLLLRFLLIAMGFDAPAGLLAGPGKWLALASIVAIPVYLRLTCRRPPLFDQCGAVVFAFLLLSPGFGFQYLAWSSPWIVALGFGPTARYYLIAGAFLTGSYAQAAWGSGLHAYANFMRNDRFSMMLGPFCWLALGVAALGFIRKLKATPVREV